MKINQLKIGTLLSYASIFISNIISIVYTPIMLNLLGQSEYGLLNLANSIVGYLGILSFGFGSAIIRYTTQYKAIGDKESEYNINGMFFTIYSIIGIITLVVGGILVSNINNIFSDSLSMQELNNIRILMILMVINLAISFPTSIFGSIIYAYEKFIFVKIVGLIRTVTSPFIMLPLLLLGYKSIGITVVNTLLNILYVGINIYYCFNILKIKIRFNRIDFSLLKEILLFSLFIFMGMIVDKIYWSTDQIILGVVKGTKEVAIYSIGSTFSSIFVSLTSVISGLLLPKFTRLISQGVDDSVISDEFIKISRMQFIICTYIFGGFLLVGKQFIEVWAGLDYLNSFYIAILIMGGLVLGITQNVGISILQAKNLHKFRAIIQLIIAIFNVVLTVNLSSKFGGVGAAFSTSICYFFGNNIIMSWYYQKKAKLNVLKLWHQLVKFIPTFIIITIISSKLNVSITYFSIFTNAIIYSAIYVILIFIINMNDYEKENILKPLLNLINSVKKKNLCLKGK